MSAIFEAFEKKRVSPSEVKTFSQDRGLWFARYVARVSDDAGPAAWRGEAVEAGLNTFLYGGQNASMIAAQTYEDRSTEWSQKNDGEIHPDHDDEAAKVAPCLERAITAWQFEPELKDVGKPSSAQQWCEVWLPGAPISMGGKWDWSFGKSGEGFSLDLKTSNSIPSEPEDGGSPKIDVDHGIQFSVYAKARNENVVRALYVSAKEYKTEAKGKPRRLHCLVTLDAAQIEFYTSAAVQALLSMQEMMKAALALSEYECTTPRAALARLCRPNMLATGGGFYNIWKPDFARAAAEAVPEWGLE